METIYRYQIFNSLHTLRAYRPVGHVWVWGQLRGEKLEIRAVQDKPLVAELVTFHCFGLISCSHD